MDTSVHLHKTKFMVHILCRNFTYWYFSTNTEIWCTSPRLLIKGYKTWAAWNSPWRISQQLSWCSLHTKCFFHQWLQVAGLLITVIARSSVSGFSLEILTIQSVDFHQPLRSWSLDFDGITEQAPCSTRLLCKFYSWFPTMRQAPVSLSTAIC